MFFSVNQNFQRFWADVRTWPKEKIVCAFIQVEAQRKKAWSCFFRTKDILASDRKDMLNMYYLFTKVEDRMKKDLRVNNRFILNILEKIGMRALGENDEYSCICCKNDMECVSKVSLLSTCGHCMHTECLEKNMVTNVVNGKDKVSGICSVCKVPYDKQDIYSIEGEPRNQIGIFKKISDYFGF
jgi:hypothetical protein